MGEKRGILGNMKYHREKILGHVKYHRERKNLPSKT